MKKSKLLLLVLTVILFSSIWYLYSTFGIIQQEVNVTHDLQRIKTNGTVNPPFQSENEFNNTLNSISIPTEKPFIICNIPSPQMDETNVDQRIFPLPKFHKYGNQKTTLSTNVKYIVHYPKDIDAKFLKDVLHFHCNIVGKVTDESKESKPDQLNYVEITIETSTDAKVNEYPQFPMDESYSITIQQQIAKIKSKTIYGTIRALETFLQFTTPCGISIPFPTTISDSPRFKWRGLSFDSSRHYFPISYIKKVIDGLSYNKYNTLHWHITDAVSFPLDIPKYPDLAKKAGHSEKQIYKEEDIKELISYAKIRGIRIVPEVDSPAHTGALYKYDKETIVTCKEPNFDKYKEVDKFAINPLSEKTIKLIHDIYDYVSGLFPDKYFHLGGDEIDVSYWYCDEKIKKYCADHNITVKNLLQKYLIDISNYVKNKNKIVLFWEGAFDSGASLDKFVGKESWKCWSNLGFNSFSSAVNEKRQAIQASCTYLDYNNYWYEYYQHDIVNDVRKNRPSKDSEYILGGEAALWCEGIDITTLEYRLWPRASVISEMYWNEHQDPKEVLHRLVTQSERMRNRNIKVSPFTYEYKPGRPYKPSTSDNGYSGYTIEASHDGFPPFLNQRTQRNTFDKTISIMVYDIEDINNNKNEFTDLIMSILPTFVFLYNVNINDGSIMQWAADNGYAYSHLIKTPKSHCIFSSHPFEIITEDKKNFKNGLLHIKIEKINYISVCVSDDIKVIKQEILSIIKYIEGYKEEPIYIIGEMNSLSQSDSSNYKDIKNIMFVENGKVNYESIKTILSNGFTDISSSQSISTFNIDNKSVRSDYIFINNQVNVMSNLKCENVNEKKKMSNHIPFICRWE